MLRSGLPEDDESVADAERFFEAFVEAHEVPEDSAVVPRSPPSTTRRAWRTSGR